MVLLILVPGCAQKTPLAVNDSQNNIGNKSENRFKSHVIEVMIIRNQNNYAKSADSPAIMSSYSYWDESRNVAYFSVIFRTNVWWTAWKPGNNELGKPIIFRIHKPELITSDQSKSIETNSNYRLKTNFWGHDSEYPVDKGDFTIEEALQQYGMSLDSVVLVDLP